MKLRSWVTDIKEGDEQQAGVFRLHCVDRRETADFYANASLQQNCALRKIVNSHIYDNLEMAVGMEHLKNSYPFIDIC